jgi:hypothetical protein
MSHQSTISSRFYPAFSYTSFINPTYPDVGSHAVPFFTSGASRPAAFWFKRINGVQAVPSADADPHLHIKIPESMNRKADAGRHKFMAFKRCPA